MLVQLDKYRSIEIPPSKRFKAYVVVYKITSNDVEISSRHSSDALAIRSAKTLQYNGPLLVKVILEDGVAYNPEIFVGW
jgi:hypothetical protein